MYFCASISFYKLEECLGFFSKSPLCTEVKACGRKLIALFFPIQTMAKWARKIAVESICIFFFGKPETFVCSFFHRHYLCLLSDNTYITGQWTAKVSWNSLDPHFFSDFEPKVAACSSGGQHRARGLSYKDGELMWVTRDLNNSDSIICQDVLHLCLTEYFCSSLVSCSLWLVEGVCRKKAFFLFTVSHPRFSWQ